jgi:hypothetical protein
MSNVFVSYAKEDKEKAEEMARELTKIGHSVFYFSNPEERGSNFIEKIANEIKKARHFIVVLSPNYLSSQWCQAEFQVALHREREAKAKGRNFSIYIVKVRHVDQELLVFERIFDHFDLTGLAADGELKALLRKLRETAKEDEVKNEKQQENIPKEADWLHFRNREEELDSLINDITNQAGNHFHIVIAAPQMGKTWLLHQLHLELLKRSGIHWMVSFADLRQETSDSRSNISKLWSHFFPAIETNSEFGLLPKLAAKQIIASKRPWLLLLDSAELLSERTAEQLRELLGQTLKELGLNRLSDKLGFVTASRMEIPAFKGIHPKPRFAITILTQFNVSLRQGGVKKWKNCALGLASDQRLA